MRESVAIDPPSFDLSLCFAPQPAHVASVSRFVRDICRSFITDEDALARLELASYELMENVVKYTSDGDGHFRLQVLDAGQSCRVLLQTQNRTDGVHQVELEQRMQRLSVAEDAVAHYDSEIAASARRPFGSGLGLARIRAEGEMVLSYSVDSQAVTNNVEAIFAAGVRR